MWSTVSKEEEERVLPLAIEFTGDHRKYGEAMRVVLGVWVVSCEQHLSDKFINRRAWLGHAACSHKFGWSEYLVRRAWGYLSQQQQRLADAEATKNIFLWESSFKQKKAKESQLSFDL